MRTKRLQPGFTLIELLVAMSITVILLGVLVYMTGISMDTYKDKRNEVRASRQAKEAIEAVAKDLESMVSRRDGNTYEWLYAGKETNAQMGPAQKEITNTSHLIFFTGATDRYNGEIGKDGVDKGGDVSAVSYRLVYRDQIGDTDDEEYAVFSLYRNLVDPDEAFDILAVDDLQAEYSTRFKSSDLQASNFLVENIYEFTVTFLVEYTPVGETSTKIERVTMRESTGGYTSVRLKGNELVATKGAGQNTDILNGQIVGAEVSITVLTDHGLTLAKRSAMTRDDLIRKHSYHYTKTINTPRP
ncbi:type II secretion system protein [Verrucomicrobiaceae bacterium N1E253]|uniref:Type II secretion system protein n=1 Tax=Oceaniferula marina TaxID=2748318 RepID=A0A851GJ44_9BACT|nr:type II secretion system protein [Oceaniferula marina]NWK57002.1 type II secretion system protein [Oceaniferula marina]